MAPSAPSRDRWLYHLPRQPIPMCNHPFCDEILPNVQPKLPLAQFKTMFSHPKLKEQTRFCGTSHLFNQHHLAHTKLFNPWKRAKLLRAQNAWGNLVKAQHPMEHGQTASARANPVPWVSSKFLICSSRSLNKPLCLINNTMKAD